MITSPPRRVIMVVLDGAPYDTTAALLAAGELPALEQIAADGSFRMATTVFPSTTGPAYVPFLTGAFPGSANIPGFRWFERDGCARQTRPRHRCRSYLGAQCALINRDLTAPYATLFESLPISIADGYQSPTTEGLGTGAPLVPVFAQRLRDARLFVWARPAVTLTHTRALRDDLRQGLHVLARLLEEGIARAPEQWVVFEPIWKDGAA